MTSAKQQTGTTASGRDSAIPSCARCKRPSLGSNGFREPFPEGKTRVRSALVRRFPYAVLFRIEGERIEVYSRSGMVTAIRRAGLEADLNS